MTSQTAMAPSRVTTALTMLPQRAHSGQCAVMKSHPLHVEQASEFDAAFSRRSGWTGADGSYSVSLQNGRTLWLFSDTLIGEVGASGQRQLDQRIPVNLAGHRFINNSLAIEEGNDPGSMRFVTGSHAGKPCSVFTPPDANEWFWVNDAVLNADGSVTVLLNSFTLSENPRYLFGKQVALWAADITLLGDEVSVGNYRRIRAVDTTGDDECETVWGAAILDDGPWTYIYGNRLPAETSDQQRGLVIARTPVGRLGDNQAWRFFNGERFVRDSRQTAVLPLQVANELSVQKLDDDRYLLIAADGYGPINFSFSSTPTGPWSRPQSVWVPAESTSTVYTYNPKAHPGQSDERGLLISYNVNSFDVDEALRNADIYRPRFIRVPWESIDLLANAA